MFSILSKSNKTATAAKKPGDASPPPPEPAAPQPSPNDGDSRAAPRRPSTSVPEITGIRFSPHGIEATLVNISDSGLLAECEQQIKPGNAVTVAFSGTFEPKLMDGRVSRCVVSSIARNGKLRYHVAVSFGKSIGLPEEEQPPAAGASAEPSTPAAAAAESPAPAAPPPPVRNRW